MPAPLGPRSISACLVVRNEEAVIERCLASLAGVVDEIVLAHAGPCLDRTVAIARGHGARVLEVGPGHSETHTPLVYEDARGEWLLALDADEWLGEDARRAIPRLVADDAVDAYAFVWPLWDGRREITRDGPHKLTLMRRSRTRMVGIIHRPESIDGVVRKVGVRLEHRPPYGHLSLEQVRRKWPWRVRAHAAEYLSDPNALPRFGYGPGHARWGRRRRIINRFAPVLVIPVALHAFVDVMRVHRATVPLGVLVRLAAFRGVYRGWVTAEIARQRLARRRHRAV